MIPKGWNIEVLRKVRDGFRIGPIPALMIAERWADKKRMMQDMYWR